MWQGVLQSLAPLVGGGLALFLYHRRTAEVEEGHQWTDAIGVGGIRMAFAFAILIWLVPAGALLVLPLLLLLSLVSPAGRQEWSKQRTPRLVALAVAMICLMATGFLPVSQPVSPDDWGQPLFTENPHAPVYPAGQQYTWVTSDVVVLQSLSMRLPHQPGVMGAETVALTLASLMNMETGRLHQAIELIDEEVPFVRLNPEEITLQPVPAPSTWDIIIGSWDSGDVETVVHRAYDINTTAFGSDPQGTKVGEVSMVAKASWGGQLDILVVVRPLQPPNVDYDPFGESWVREWLVARG